MRATQTCFPPRLPSNNNVFIRHTHSWHRIHRTRRGAYIPATACPAGANTLLTVMSGTLEVLVYAPADGLPCLKPTFGNTPCSLSGAEDITYTDEQKDSNVGDATKNDEPIQKQSGLLDDEKTAEERGDQSNTTPKPSPGGLLEEALGLGRKSSGEDHQSLPRDIVDEMEDEDSTEGTNIDEDVPLDEGFQAVGAIKSKSNDNGGNFSDSLESLYWPHEPRYCADVWHQDGNQDDGTVTRFVWSFPLWVLAPCHVRHTRGGRYN